MERKQTEKGSQKVELCVLSSCHTKRPNHMPPSNSNPDPFTVLLNRFCVASQANVDGTFICFIASQKGLKQSLIIESEQKTRPHENKTKAGKMHETMNKFSLTIYIQNYGFIVRRRQVRVTCHTYTQIYQTNRQLDCLINEVPKAVPDLHKLFRLTSMANRIDEVLNRFYRMNSKTSMTVMF